MDLNIEKSGSAQVRESGGLLPKAKERVQDQDTKRVNRLVAQPGKIALDLQRRAEIRRRHSVRNI
jgi:hypothetical protein